MEWMERPTAAGASRSSFHRRVEGGRLMRWCLRLPGRCSSDTLVMSGSAELMWGLLFGKFSSTSCTFTTLTYTTKVIKMADQEVDNLATGISKLLETASGASDEQATNSALAYVTRCKSRAEFHHRFFLMLLSFCLNTGKDLFAVKVTEPATRAIAGIMSLCCGTPRQTVFPFPAHGAIFS